MKRVSLFVCTGLGALAFAMGCQAIADLQTRTLNPLPTVGCALPSTGNARVRLMNVANVGPGSTNVSSAANYADFCIRPSGTSDWGRAIFREEGTDALCLGGGGRPGGLAYGEATVPFAVPAGKIDVKAIPSGQACSAAGTSEKDGVAVGDVTSGANPVIMLMRWGGGTAQAEEIAALPEEPASNLVGNASSLIRAINALSDNVSVLLGEGAAPSLPTTAADILNTAPIAPGSTLPASPDQLGKVDSYGYQNFIPASLNLVFTKAGDTSQSALTLQTTANSQVISTFLIVGDPGDVTNAHPVRGLYCEDKDTLAAGGSGTTVGDGGAGSLNSLDDSLLADCSFSPLPVLSFDIANLSLYGANAPFESSRQQVIDGINGFTSPVGARTSAFMCILEADRGSDKTNIINAAGTGPNGSGSFPYSYFASSTIATQPTLPADQKPTPQYAPCGGSVSQTTVTDLFNCVEGSCDTLGNDVGTGAGVLSGGTQCFSNGPCFIDFAHLYTNLHGPPRTGEPIQNDSCFDCLIYDMTSDQTYATVQTECNDDVQPFAFDGQTPGMILSKYPIVSSLVYYLPVTGYRRAVLKVQAQLEDQKLDFFCAQLTSPFVDGDLPYVGNFGSDALEDGGTTGNGWEQEQDLQATEAVTWITQQIQADGVAAIVATDLHSSPGASQGTDDGGGIVTASQSPEVLATFNGGQGFVPAIPNGFTETCDYCPAPENPYNGDALPYELMHAWTVGFPPNAIQTESNWGNDNSQVQLTATAGQTLPPGGTGPLFEYYAHNYTVIRPTPK